MISTELAVVGAGPAGLAAVAEACRHGVATVLLDDNARPGGQYLPPGAGDASARLGHARPPTGTGRRGGVGERPARGRVASAGHLPAGTVVWAAPEPHVLALAGSGGGERLRAELIVVATGAIDRAVAFPGWTLPGVITAGGAQNLMKSQGVLPGRRVVVAGTGPLLLVVADSLRRAGANVVEVLEAAEQRHPWRWLPRLAAAPALLRRGLRYRAGLARAGIPFRTGHTVIEARGADTVREVVVAPIDARGHVDRRRARRLAADALVVGFGLTPAVELTRLLGCEHTWDAARGGLIPRRSTDLESSVPGVLVAGDGAGIAGVESALVEGRLAGLLAAERLGRCPAAGGPGDRGGPASPARPPRAIPPGDRAPPRPAARLPCAAHRGDRRLPLRGGDGGRRVRRPRARSRERGRAQGRDARGHGAMPGSELPAHDRRDPGPRASDVRPATSPCPGARPPARPVRLGDLVGEALPPARPPEMPLP